MTLFARQCLHSGTTHLQAQANHRPNTDDAPVQRASQLFLQQVEDSRRKYAFEVEELKVKPGLSGAAHSKC